MSRILAFALIVSVIGFAAFSGGSSQPAKKGDSKPVSIPKDQIYTTSSEPGFKERLQAVFTLDEKKEPRKPKHDYTFDLNAIGDRHGPSSVFLVRGDDLATIIASTRMIHVGGNADSPPDQDIYGKPIKSDKFWLIAYLGSGHSVPPKWEIKSCTVAGNKIEFRYERMDATGEPMATSTDGIQYFYWVPLPPLKKGTVELKLFDCNKNRPTLIRYVERP